MSTVIRRRELRHAYPEFLPDPNPDYRNPLREKLERADMLKRREMIDLPEFYVGSIVAVTVADPNVGLGTPPTKANAGTVYEKRTRYVMLQLILVLIQYYHMILRLFHVQN